MADRSSWVFVDDRDPAIAYSGSVWHGGVAQEYDQTTTGLKSGDSLTYYFNASRIGVFGTYGPTGSGGPPIAIYQVDNFTATTVTAPATQATLYRQAFWTSDAKPLPLLAPGTFHKLTATSLNAPIWIDYIAYPPTTSVDADPTANAKTNTPALVAGVVIGTLTVILVATAFVYMRNRWSRTTMGHSIKEQMDSTPDVTRTPTVAPDSLIPEDASLSVPQQEGTQDPTARPLPPSPVTMVVGCFGLTGGSVERPPEYQEHH